MPIARCKTASPNRELLCPKGLRKSAEPPVRDRIGEQPPSNQSLTSASQGFCRNLPGRRKGPRRSRIGLHRLQSSRHTHGPWLKTILQTPRPPVSVVGLSSLPRPSWRHDSDEYWDSWNRLA